MKLVLENNQGQAVRAFFLASDSAVVVKRLDSRRLEIHSDLKSLDAQKIKYVALGEIHREKIAGEPFSIGSMGRLRVAQDVFETARNVEVQAENSRLWHVSLLFFAIFQCGILALMMKAPAKTASIEKDLKQQVVQIVKKIPVSKPKPPSQIVNASQVARHEPTQKTPTSKTASLKRVGALAVLGSLKKGAQRGGLDLGAVKTTAGPGLGGTEGSGGTQTTLYGKGLVAAPLGPGANIQGGGGYGTKGKGGGQAGYGKISLIGSSGSSSIPLGREALIEGGLDRDLIAGVINRNMGQIRFCYEQGLQGDPALSGRVAIAFVIGENGQVKSADVANTTLNSKFVEDCIVLRLKSWKFPLPEGGVDVKVSYPFMLRRAGQG